MGRSTSALTTKSLRLIAHGLSHYDMSHGNLPLLRLPLYTCDEEATWISEVGYRDVRRVFEELAALRAVVEDVRALAEEIEAAPNSGGILLTSEVLALLPEPS